MTAVQIIEEIKRLPKGERNIVLEFARRDAEARLLTPEQLGDLARRMMETQDPAEADRLQEEIVQGFYGEASHAQNPPS